MLKEIYIRPQITLIVLVNVIEKLSTRKCQYWEDYRKKEMVGSSEFLTSLISKLFQDEITDNPFEIIFANLEQCLARYFTEGEIEGNNCMRVMVWDS